MEQTSLGVGGPALSDNPSAAASAWRRELETRVLPALGLEVARVRRDGRPIAEEVRGRVLAYVDRPAWPHFLTSESGESVALVRALAATEKNARRVPRQWTMELHVFEALVALDHALLDLCRRGLHPALRVVLAFDDGLAARIGDLVPNRHWSVVGNGHTRHVAIEEAGRLPLSDLLAS